MSGAPSVASPNRYSCLYKDIPNKSAVETKDAPPIPAPEAKTPSIPRVRRPRWERKLPQRYVIDSVEGRNSLHIPLEMQSVETAATMSVKGLVDCGATGDFIDSEYVISRNLPVQKLSSLFRSSMSMGHLMYPETSPIKPRQPH